MKTLSIISWLPILTGLTLLLAGCANTDTPARVRIASGPPLAESLEPEQRIHPTSTGVYVVQPGDTLWAIAVAHAVDLEELASWNLIKNPDQLFISQELKVKKPEPKPVKQIIKPPSNKKLAGMATQLATQTATRLATQTATQAATQTALKTTNIKPIKPAPILRPATIKPIPQTLKQDLPPPKAIPQQNTKRKLKPAKNAWVLKSGAPKKWLWPVNGKILKTFGRRGATRNTGIDIAAKVGQHVKASADGVVAYADDALAGYGKLILLRHGGSFMSAYAHNDKILVKRGDMVRAGETIARAGTTGRAKSPRVHFELRKSIKPLNPLKYLPPRKKRGS